MPLGAATPPEKAESVPTSEISRRAVLGAGVASTVAFAVPQSFAGASAPADRRQLTKRIERLERQYQARAGVAWIDGQDGTRFSYRGTERWAFCSTFKTHAAAALLDRARHGAVDLASAAVITPEDVVVNSPESSDFVGYAMPLRWSAKVALVWSDNTAGNRMIEALGGPGDVTAFAHSVGDTEFRLDRWEPELNSAVPGDSRDTTTPDSIASGYRSLLLGDALHGDDRALLDRWMTGNVTSTARIRAGLPAGWTSADKTGAGAYGTVNDVGVVRSPDGRSFVLALLTDRPTSAPDTRGDNALLAELTAEVVGALGQP